MSILSDSSSNLNAINDYFNRTTATTDEAKRQKTAWGVWWNNLSWFDKQSDSVLADATAKRTAFNLANKTPELPSTPLTKEEADYFKNIPVVDVTGLSKEEAQKKIWTPVPGSAKAPISLTVARTTIKMGSKGENVKEWQRIVGATPVDGNFGKGTDTLTRTWQKNHGLKVDGIVGPNTWAAAYGDAPKMHPEIPSASTPASKAAAVNAGVNPKATPAPNAPIPVLPSQKTPNQHTTGLKPSLPKPNIPPNIPTPVTPPVIQQAGMLGFLSTTKGKITAGVVTLLALVIGVKVAKSPKYGPTSHA